MAILIITMLQRLWLVECEIVIILAITFSEATSSLAICSRQYLF